MVMFNTLFRFSDPNLPFRSSLLFSPISDVETCISYELIGIPLIWSAKLSTETYLVSGYRLLFKTFNKLLSSQYCMQFSSQKTTEQTRLQHRPAVIILLYLLNTRDAHGRGPSGGRVRAWVWGFVRGVEQGDYNTTV